jgi:membrane protease YdiL (CAAX protease family)
MLVVVARTALVLLLVAAASWFAPSAVAGTFVSLVFLLAVWWLVWRIQSDARAYGLSVGGLFDVPPSPFRARRMARDIGFAIALAGLVFPFFALGVRLYFGSHPAGSFHLPTAHDCLAEVFGVAMPEEFFFRGYVQSSLVIARKKQASEGGLRAIRSELLENIVTSALFAAGHFLTIASPARLATFFPSLLFGALRSYTGSVESSLVLHALFNLMSQSLGAAS